ncbi:MAG TPA: YodL domain-containing protein [Pyrinomonadaceae bacterium]|jgi:hypothetical protein
MHIELERVAGEERPPEPSAVSAEITFTAGAGFRIHPTACTARVNVSIFLNETEGHRFNEYHASDELRLAWEGEIRFDVGADDDTRLNAVYEIFNINRPQGYRDRSLSMADVVMLDGERRYSVERFGFQRLSDFAAPPAVSTIMRWKNEHGGAIRDFYRAHHTCGRCRGAGLCAPFYSDDLAGRDVCQQCGGCGAWFDEPVYSIVPRSDEGHELAALLLALSSYEPRGPVNTAAYLSKRLSRIGLRKYEHERALELAATLAEIAEPFVADRIGGGRLLCPAPRWINDLTCPTCQQVGFECGCPCPACALRGETCPDCIAGEVEAAERRAGWDATP